METQLLENIKQKYAQTLTLLKDKSNNKEFFDKFVATSKVKDVNGALIVIVAKNNFAKQVIINDFLNQISAAFNEIEKTNFSFEVISENENKVITTKIDYKPTGRVIGINKDYTFDSLVKGMFNNAAILAGQSINTDHFISPLFISSNVGLGKTHLLHAIGNEFRKTYPNKSIKYVSSDDFSRQVYNGLISDDKTLIEKIKDEYNSYDLLLIDDIQILASRTKINEILFGIFNNAIRDKRFIVFTSDKNVDLLTGFEDRMKSRFHSGITVSIQRPDIPSLIEIINKKVEQLGNAYKFNEDSLNFIARRANGDIRRLEGDINQIFFFAANNLPKYSIIDLANVKSILAPDSSGKIDDFGFDIDPNIVIEQICNSYGVKSEMVKSKSKLSYLITPRNVCMYVLRKKFDMTFAQIGSLFSGRDHSTVMSAIEKIEKVIKSDNDLRLTIENIYNKI